MLEIYNGQLMDMSRGKMYGRVVGGYYGTSVVNDMHQKVGEISSSTMCGGTFMKFTETPSISNSFSSLGKTTYFD